MAQKDMNEKLGKVLSAIGPDKLKKGLEAFEKMSKSGEAEKLKKQISSFDKEKLLDMFNGLGADQIKKKLEKLDLGNLDLGDLTKKAEILNKENKKK